MTLGERIERILIENYLAGDTADQILLAVKEAMPEKKKDEFFSDVMWWNECLEEMERRLV